MSQVEPIGAIVPKDGRHNLRTSAYCRHFRRSARACFALL